MAERYPVVIVGGGPVGVGLAVDLGLRGVRCIVVEKRDTLSRIPKGQGLSQRTLEHCWFWGVADDIRAARVMPPDHAIGQVTVYRDLMGEFWHASPDRALVAPYYFQTNERLPQYRTEEVLRARMAQLPDVDALWGWTATSVEQDDDGVRVVVERGGERQVLAGDYVVGCDGGHSVVREQADIERSGTDFDELVALVVFRSKELHRALERFPDRSTYRVMHPDLHGYWMFFGRVDVGEEFFFHAPVPRGATADTFDFAALLHRAAGFEFECEIDHVGFWDLRVQVATAYRAGRAFIAGDAAHTHPPYGGFGLNNGLEDAANLGWKLAAVLEGWGGDALLESYSLERQPVFRGVGEDIIGGWIRDDRAFFERYSPERDRDEFARAFEEQTKGFGDAVARLRAALRGVARGARPARGRGQRAGRAHLRGARRAPPAAAPARLRARRLRGARHAASRCSSSAADRGGRPGVRGGREAAGGAAHRRLRARSPTDVEELRLPARAGAARPVRGLGRRRRPGRRRGRDPDGHRTPLTSRASLRAAMLAVMRRSWLVAAVLCAGCTAGRSGSAPPVTPPPDAPALQVDVVVDGLDHAWDVVQASDGTLLVDERPGGFTAVLPDGTVRTVDADFGDLFARGETGLMGLVLDPGFDDNRRFYSCQGVTDGADGPVIQVIAWSWRRTGARRPAPPTRWSATSRSTQASGRHGGCRLRFTPDGALLIGTGDNAAGHQPAGPDLAGRARCCSPTPRTGEVAVCTYGHRNVQGLAVRPGTGQIFSVEHGPAATTRSTCCGPAPTTATTPTAPTARTTRACR